MKPIKMSILEVCSSKGEGGGKILTFSLVYYHNSNMPLPWWSFYQIIFQVFTVRKLVEAYQNCSRHSCEN